MIEPHIKERKHKLLTEKLEETIPPLYTHENDKAEDVPVHIKFFCPYNQWTWYATEGSREGDDFIFFGWVHGSFPELGYFSLTEMAETMITVFGVSVPAIERDTSFYPGEITLAQAMLEMEPVEEEGGESI